MKKEQFKTRLTKRQKQKNILVVLGFFILSYIFMLLFGFAIGMFKSSSGLEVLSLGLVLSFFVLSMLLFPALIGAVVLGLQKGKAKRVRDDSTFVSVQNIEYYRDMLGRINPSIVSLLVDLDIYGKKDIAATLLRMYNKKIIDFKKNGTIVLLDNENNKIEKSEAELLNMIRTGRLNDKKSLSQWKKNQFCEAEALGYIKKRKVENQKRNRAYILMCLLGIVLAFALWGVSLHLNIYEVDVPMDLIKCTISLLLVDVLLFVPMFCLCKEAGYYKREDILWECTPLGNEMAEKIAGLSRFINEFSLLSEAIKEQVVLWDDYLVYAIILEENEKIVKEISKSYHFDLHRFDRMW